MDKVIQIYDSDEEEEEEERAPKRSRRDDELVARVAEDVDVMLTNAGMTDGTKLLPELWDKILEEYTPLELARLSQASTELHVACEAKLGQVCDAVFRSPITNLPLRLYTACRAVVAQGTRSFAELYMFMNQRCRIASAVILHELFGATQAEDYDHTHYGFYVETHWGQGLGRRISRRPVQYAPWRGTPHSTLGNGVSHSALSLVTATPVAVGQQHPILRLEQPLVFGRNDIINNVFPLIFVPDHRMRRERGHLWHMAPISVPNPWRDRTQTFARTIVNVATGRAVCRLDVEVIINEYGRYGREKSMQVRLHLRALDMDAFFFATQLTEATYIVPDDARFLDGHDAQPPLKHELLLGAFFAHIKKRSHNISDAADFSAGNDNLFLFEGRPVLFD